MEIKIKIKIRHQNKQQLKGSEKYDFTISVSTREWILYSGVYREEALSCLPLAEFLAVGPSSKRSLLLIWLMDGFIKGKAVSQIIIMVNTQNLYGQIYLLVKVIHKTKPKIHNTITIKTIKTCHKTQLASNQSFYKSSPGQFSFDQLLESQQDRCQLPEEEKTE